MTIAPAGAFCAVNEQGQIQPDHCFYYRHDVERSIPRGKRWTVMRVIIEPSTQWEERDEAARAVSELPDCVAAAVMMGGQRDEWAEEETL